jgi:hypothetical protein
LPSLSNIAFVRTHVLGAEATRIHPTEDANMPQMFLENRGSYGLCRRIGYTFEGGVQNPDSKDHIVGQQRISTSKNRSKTT